MIKLFVENTCY